MKCLNCEVEYPDGKVHACRPSDLKKKVVDKPAVKASVKDSE